MGSFPAPASGGGGYPGAYPITNADIAAAAGIVKSKLAALGIVDADIAAGAAIAKSKLGALGIVDADIAAGAAIAKSKLGALGIVDADIAGGAAIAIAKLAGYPADAAQTLKGDGSWGAPPAASGVVPIGGVLPYSGSGDPAGGQFLLADGRAISRATYATLFGVHGTTYGAGDGSTTFGIPDLRGRVPVGPNTMGTAQGASGRTTANNAMGNGGGEENHLLVTGEIPSHTHNVQVDSAGNPSAGSASYLGSSLGGAAHNSGAAGGGAVHNNMQPFQVLNWLIRVL